MLLVELITPKENLIMAWRGDRYEYMDMGWNMCTSVSQVLAVTIFRVKVKGKGKVFPLQA
jgi:hypothetical protein